VVVVVVVDQGGLLLLLLMQDVVLVMIKAALLLLLLLPAVHVQPTTFQILQHTPCSCQHFTNSIDSELCCLALHGLLFCQLSVQQLVLVCLLLQLLLVQHSCGVCQRQPRLSPGELQLLVLQGSCACCL
jgi:hypothetical protein